MQTEDLIPIEPLCAQYKIELNFIDSLYEIGLIELVTKEKEKFIDREHLADVEHLLRLHSDLGINLEGVEAISYLLEKVHDLQHEILILKSRAGE